MNNLRPDFEALVIDSSFTDESLASKLRMMDLSDITQLKVTNGELTKFKLPEDIVFPSLTSCLFVSNPTRPFYVPPRRPDIETDRDSGKLAEIDVDLATSFPLIEALTITQCTKLSKVELFHGKNSKELATLNVSKSFTSFKAFSQFLNHALDHSPSLKDLHGSWLTLEDAHNNVLEISLDKCPQLEVIFFQNIEAFSSVLLHSKETHQVKRFSFQQTTGLKTIQLDPTITIEDALTIGDYKGETKLQTDISAFTGCKSITLSGRCWRDFNFENAKFENLLQLSVLRSSPIVSSESLLYVYEKEGEYSKDEAMEIQDSILRTLSHHEHFPSLNLLTSEFVQDVDLFVDLLNRLPTLLVSFDVWDKTNTKPFELCKPTKLDRVNIENGQYPLIKISNQDSLDEISINCLPKCSSIEISDCSTLSLVEIYSLEEKFSIVVKNCPELAEIRLEKVEHIESLEVDESCKYLEELVVENGKPFNMKIPQSVLDYLRLVSLGEIDELSASLSNATTIYIFSESSLKNLELRNTKELRELYVNGFPTRFTIEDVPKLEHVTASEGSGVYAHFKSILALADAKNPLKSHSIIDNVSDDLTEAGSFYGGKVYQNGEDKYCHFEGDRSCPICLDELTEECIILSCGHPLHDECLKELLKDSGDCPLCNSKLRGQSFELKAF
ncbi:BA75_04752T0 [Komagataella pastoris]|uniref:BA75_04752T0 n=1 Tax=Komagataella pastoris TaxID=4922 RepID=A0A1B2JI25_PICPA|nr:BA75_04752T0 [Komagataella pastoris]